MARDSSVKGMPSADYTHFAFGSNDVAFAPGGLEVASRVGLRQRRCRQHGGGNFETAGRRGHPAGPGGLHKRRRPASGSAARRVGQGPGHLERRLPHPDVDLGPAAQRRIPTGRVRRNHRRLVRSAGTSTSTCGRRPPTTTSPRAAAANFKGMTRDGSKVFFTSDEQMTGDDTRREHRPLQVGREWRRTR